MLIFQHTYETLPPVPSVLANILQTDQHPMCAETAGLPERRGCFIVKFTGWGPKSSKPAGISCMSLHKPLNPFSPQATTTTNPQHTKGVL